MHAKQLVLAEELLHLWSGQYNGTTRVVMPSSSVTLITCTNIIIEHYMAPLLIVRL